MDVGGNLKNYKKNALLRLEELNADIILLSTLMDNNYIKPHIDAIFVG